MKRRQTPTDITAATERLRELPSGAGALGWFSAAAEPMAFLQVAPSHGLVQTCGNQLPREQKHKMADAMADPPRRPRTTRCGTGLAASHFISGRFSAPVEQLAVDSAENLAGRERAEAELAADVTVWGGTGNAWTEITDNAFDQCFLDQNGCDRWVDYQQLDFGGLLGLTVQLGPKSGQVNLVPTYPHSDHSDHSDGGWLGGS